MIADAIRSSSTALFIHDSIAQDLQRLIDKGRADATERAYAERRVSAQRAFEVRLTFEQRGDFAIPQFAAER